MNLVTQLPEHLAGIAQTGLEEVTTGIYRGESAIRGVDGPVYIKYRFSAIQNESGALAAVSLQVKNITGRKIYEKRLLGSEQKFRSILENAAAPILVLDKTGQVVLMNSALESLLDRNFEEIFNTPASSHLEGFEELLDRVRIKPDAPVQFGDDHPVRVQTGTGVQRFAAGSISAFFTEGEPFYLVVLLDITKRVLFESHIRMQNNRLKDIAYEQAHGVRRPLANILGLVDLLKDSPTDTELLQALDDESKALDLIVKTVIEKTVNPAPAP